MFEWLKNAGNSIGWIANLVQVGAVAWAVIALLRARRDYRRRTKLLELKPAEGAVAIAVGVGTHIESSVRNFLESRFGAVDGKSKMPLVASYDKKGHIKREEFLSVFHEIRRDIDELRKKGDIREVHLFYGGPYAIAVGMARS